MICVELLVFMHKVGRGTITFVDNNSRFGYLYLVYKKSIVLDKFIEFKAKSDNLLGKYIKALQLYWSGEFMSSKLNFFLRKYSTISQLNVMGTLLQKGVKKKKKFNFDGHNGINDKFLIPSHILLGICLVNYLTCFT